MKKAVKTETEQKAEQTAIFIKGSLHLQFSLCEEALVPQEEESGQRIALKRRLEKKKDCLLEILEKAAVELDGVFYNIKIEPFK